MSISSYSADSHTTLIAPHAQSRANSGRIVFLEDFRSLNPGVWNDSSGSATRDCDVMFSGMPTLRLDPQGYASSTVTQPGRVETTYGPVVKRRIHDGFTGNFGLEAWFRFTSTGLTANTFLTMSLYNRDGTNSYQGRVWLNPSGNNQPMQAYILDGAATNALSGTNSSGTASWISVVTSVLQNGAGSHTYSPSQGGLDRAGGWHYVKLVLNMATKQYVSITLDGQPTVNLTTGCAANSGGPYLMDTTTSTGFAGFHFSFEMFMCSNDGQPRYVNIAQLMGTNE